MIIYKITNKINEKIYIGQTKNFKKRINAHLYRIKEKDRNEHLYNAFRKYGQENFTFEVLCECDSKDELDEMEFHYIKQYDSIENGYNLTLGGEGSYGHITSDITKRKISEKAKERFRNNPDLRMKMCESRKGISHGPHSEETKKKISEANKGKQYYLGKHHSEESKQKIGNANRGRKHSEESKQKMSEFQKERCNTNEHKEWFIESILKNKDVREKIKLSKADYIHSDETRKKISESNKGKKRDSDFIKNLININSKEWIILSPDGKSFRIKNLISFCKENNLRYGSMTNVADGIWKQYKGWKCERV